MRKLPPIPADWVQTIRKIGGGALFLLLLSGCAFPHRVGYSYHRIWSYADGSRPDGLVRYEEIKDRESGGGLFFLSTSSAQALKANHFNQKLLGGGSMVAIGDFKNATDPQASAVIDSFGKAAGDILGQAIHTGAGLPPVPAVK